MSKRSTDDRRLSGLPEAKRKRILDVVEDSKDLTTTEKEYLLDTLDLFTVDAVIQLQLLNFRLTDAIVSRDSSLVDCLDGFTSIGRFSVKCPVETVLKEMNVRYDPKNQIILGLDLQGANMVMHQVAERKKQWIARVQNIWGATLDKVVRTSGDEFLGFFAKYSVLREFMDVKSRERDCQ
jgi:hypothetical protein